MPVRNEGRYMERSLCSVLAQDYPRERLEVLVADGMSTDDTRETIERIAAGDGRVRVADNPGRIVPTGLNRALEQAKGEIIVRVDGHCEIAPDYVSKCVGYLLSGQADGVGGPIETIGEDPVSRTIALAMSTPFGVGGSAFRTVKDKTMPVDTVAFPAYTRSALQMAGPFDEELVRNQDDEYNYRLRKLGGRVLLAGDIRSRYYSRGSLRSLWRQYFQYGFWKVRVMQKHTRQMKLRQFAPPLLVASLLAAGLLAPFSRWGRGLAAAVAGLYAAANLAASVLTARRAGWEHLPRLPLVFAGLQLGYGAGFLAGLVRFRKRWGDRATRVGGEALPD
jgi:glycosyltransferase involved in cell wall biosynthesis